MAQSAKTAVVLAIQNYFVHEEKTENQIDELESRVDTYEDRLGGYLIQLSGGSNTQRDKRRITKLLHSIGNWERISDYARDLSKSAKEIRDKRLEISEKATAQLHALSAAVEEIISITEQAFVTTDVRLAEKIEPLEQVIDLLVEKCRESHISRLQDGECTLERGFILADTLNSYERISDHCSNIAIAVLESGEETFSPHEYMRQVKSGDDPVFQRLFDQYQARYLSAFPDA